jgi:hypothetical protein
MGRQFNSAPPALVPKPRPTSTSADLSLFKASSKYPRKAVVGSPKFAKWRNNRERFSKACIKMTVLEDGQQETQEGDIYG